ncbi:MAG: CCA tRNA nucleotidyltransferase [Pseudomonadota bacterium]
MRLNGPWLTDPRTAQVFDAIEGEGHRAFFVGGVVRNAALGMSVSDIDLATDAHPETVSNAAEKAGLRVVPTGIAHGTVTVVSGGLPHEVTTFRRDVETDGRRAVVAFTDQLEADAARRDFTMNALYADRAGNVVDTVGGLADIAARRVRFVGDPSARVAEDYLRILRFFRFYAWYGDPGGGIDADGLAAVAAGADGLDTLPGERVGYEMLRLLAACNPAPALASMAQTGILARVLPGASADVITRLVHVEAGADPDAIRRLAALGGQNPEKRLRLSRRDASRVTSLKAAIGASTGLAEIAWRDGPRMANDVAQLRAAVFEMPLPDDAPHQIALGAQAEFPVRPADLMPDHQGAALGARLAELEERWIASGFQLTREALLSRG